MDDEDLRTIWCGNLSEKVTEDVLYELFMQGGPVQKVSIPKDRDGKQKNFGFVTFKHECSVPYALNLFDGTTLFKRTLNMKSRNNSLNNAFYLQQKAFQQPQKMQQQGNIFDEQFTIPNEFGQALAQKIAIASDTVFSMPNGYNHMFEMPGSVTYPSQGQGSFYGSQKNITDYGKNNRQSRNYPYPDRDHYNDRHNRHEPYDRDHKSYKHSSHRSNRHDNRRKYR